jgi:hypothetical protein
VVVRVVVTQELHFGTEDQEVEEDILLHHKVLETCHQQAHHKETQVETHPQDFKQAVAAELAPEPQTTSAPLVAAVCMEAVAADAASV